MARRLVIAVAALAMLSQVASAVFAQGQAAAGSGSGAAGAVSARVDRLFAQWDTPDTAGCSLGVSRDGAVVYERGYGMANLDLGVPITPASVFHVASVSKQFTAMAIVLLAERGRLSLDDEVRKYITELPDYGTPLTLRHLLSHTGGLRDEFLLRELTAPRDDDGDPNGALVKLLAHQRGLNFAPGTEYQYSNAGYTLLGTIVKRVSGQSLRAFADANIFKPLGMTHTHVHDDPSMIVPNRASGYSGGGGPLRVAVHSDPGGIVGNTGLFTTVQDLLLWEQNFAKMRVGAPALLAAMQAPTVLAGGETSDYGLGLQVGRHRGLRTVGHGGNDPGYSAQVVRYPERGLAVAVLCNIDGIDAAGLAREVAEIHLEGQFPSPPESGPAAPTPRVSLSAEQMASKAGLYRDPATEGLLRVFVRDGKLMGSGGAGDDGGFELTAMDTNRFTVRGIVTLEFVPATAGRAQELHIIHDTPKQEILQRLDAYAPSAAQLHVFAGDYTSPDLAVTYQLAVHDTQLVIHVPGRKDIRLRPIFPGGFAGEIVGVVKFARDAAGTISGFTLNSPGVRGLSFERQPTARGR